MKQWDQKTLMLLHEANVRFAKFDGDDLVEVHFFQLPSEKAPTIANVVDEEEREFLAHMDEEAKKAEERRRYEQMAYRSSS